MISRRTTLLWLAIGILALITMVFGMDSRANRSTYEIRPTVATPQYRSDAARAIDAYERLMDRYMSLIEQNLITLQADKQNTSQRLIELEKTLSRIEQKVDRLNQALEPCSDYTTPSSAPPTVHSPAKSGSESPH